MSRRLKTPPTGGLLSPRWRRKTAICVSSQSMGEHEVRLLVLTRRASGVSARAFGRCCDCWEGASPRGTSSNWNSGTDGTDGTLYKVSAAGVVGEGNKLAAPCQLPIVAIGVSSWSCVIALSCTVSLEVTLEDERSAPISAGVSEPNLCPAAVVGSACRAPIAGVAVQSVGCEPKDCPAGTVSGISLSKMSPPKAIADNGVLEVGLPHW
mmetsp:Transcript_32385/g.58081  ORF Transcript_32385/g.58081 Transcript_32385/m.58081 type:complete len:209 (+) Transcript_32385:471-1097(+)